MTEKEKQYRREYARDYYETHKDYFKEYYKEHREEMKARSQKYRKEHREDCVYFHINENGESIYIGSTTRNLKERQSCHLRGCSNLEMDILEYIEKYDFTNIYYKDFTKYNLTKTDIRFIEKYFKKRYGEKIPSKVDCNENNLSKSKSELIEIAENEEFKLFDLTKYINKYLN